MDSFDHEEEMTMGAVYGQGYQNYISPQYSYSSLSSPNMINILSSNTKITPSYNFPTIIHTPLIKQNNNPTNDHSKFSTTDHHVVINHDQDSSAPIAADFRNINNPSENIQQVNLSLPLNNKSCENDKLSCQPTKRKARTRAPSQVYEHIIAERKRREQLSQLFIALSAIVPGLKKTDKTSILGDAIKHLKHLKHRVQNLEEKSASKEAMDPGVFVRKSQIFVEDEGSSDYKGGGGDEPEIEARVVNNSILIRVQCGKQKGILANLLSKVESLNMVVVNTNVNPFGNSALDITIIAEMEKGFNLTVKEVATSLRAVFRSAAV